MFSGPILISICSVTASLADISFSVLEQAECEGVPMNPDFQHLHNELWARQTAAIERASSSSLAAAAEARDAASRQMPEYKDPATRVRTA